MVAKKKSIWMWLITTIAKEDILNTVIWQELTYSSTFSQRESQNVARSVKVLYVCQTWHRIDVINYLKNYIYINFHEKVTHTLYKLS